MHFLVLLLLVATLSGIWAEEDGGRPSAQIVPETQQQPMAHAQKPFYLSVPDFEKCLGEKQVDSATSWCMPDAKPAECDEESWKQLNDEDGTIPKCTDATLEEAAPEPVPQSPNLNGAQRELTVRELIARDLPTQVEPTDPNANVPQKTMLPGVKRPRYLDVEGYDKCLDKTEDGDAQHWCMPNVKPEQCADASWQQLNDDKQMSIPKCPEPSVQQPTIRELLAQEEVPQVSSDPSEVSSNEPNSKPTIGAAAPAYLRIKGFKHCVKTTMTNGYESVCLPKQKPHGFFIFGCKQSVWVKLQQKNVGLPPCSP